MKRNILWGFHVVTFVILAAPLGLAADAGPVARADLGRTYPGVRTETFAQRVTAIYGKPMTAGPTASDAAANWLALHADALGVARLELQLTQVFDVNDGRFTAFHYEQTIGGIPVEQGIARILVRNLDQPRVVFVGGHLAQAPADGLLAGAAPVSGAQALALVQKMPAYANLPVWSQPEPVIHYTLERFGSSAQAWKFYGENPDLTARERYAFFVDQRSGLVLEIRDEVTTTDVSGNVSGNATPGLRADSASNPPAVAPIPLMRVRISGGSNALTDVNGDYTIANGGAGSVTVTAGVSSGRWVNVNNQAAGGDLALSQSVTPPGPADFLFNPSPSELTTAQVNAFIHTNLIHNYIRDRSPGGFPGLDIAIPANVNVDNNCNAFFDGASINFFTSGGNCNNTAYSTVIAHEYGHFIVSVLGLSQGAFGEGYGDTVSIMLYDTGVIGRDFCGPGCNIRNPGTASRQFPCSGEIHFCGEVLAGTWFDIKQAFKATYGNTTGLEMSRQLQVDWSALTLGGQGTNSAHPQTAIEVLTLDDDDGDIDNGTPNYDDICPAFANHGIACPEIIPVTFVFPNGLPDQLAPGVDTLIDVNILPGAGTPISGTGMVSYRTGGSGAFTTVPMAENAPNEYTATLPAADCGQSVQFFFTAGSSIGDGTSPAGAPNNTHDAVARLGQVDVFVDDFESDLGWTITGSALDGPWERAVPISNSVCDRGNPGSDADGSGRCYVTDNSSAGACNSDVDDGFTRLMSPSIDLSGAPGATVSYWRWYSNTVGNAPMADTFLVHARADGGAWVLIEQVGPTGAEVNGGWFFHEVNLGDFIPLTADVQIRFSASDLNDGSVVEAGVDGFRVAVHECPPATCPGDLDGDGDIGLSDLSILLSNFGTAFGATAEDGDLDGDGDVDLTDLSTLLAVFGTSCG